MKDLHQTYLWRWFRASGAANSNVINGMTTSEIDMWFPRLWAVQRRNVGYAFLSPQALMSMNVKVKCEV
ncbi:hypothetical protein EVAR_83097_1 [Eumeta japonica]|uniref:Uncharacterized protein n=1 Tax=Eumeta variegata TaxID=151549 RepID=A0A4C1WLA4_EUMVA|nr:hypothetical protein EVAR_83097_1 [Eumeta japonica]